MGLIARQSFKAASVTYAGVLFGVLNQILLYPLFLSIEEYGEIQFVLQTGGMFAPFILMGITSMFVKYYSTVKSDKIKKQSLYGMVLLMLSANTTMFLLVYFVFSDQIKSYYCDGSGVSEISVTILFLFASLLPTIGLSRTIASVHGRIAIPSLFLQGVKLVLPLVALLYYIAYLTFDQILVVLLIFYVMLCMIFVLYTYRCDKTIPILSLKRIKQNLNLNPMFVFAFFSLLTGIGSAFANQIDIVMITAIKGTYQNGLYSWALFIANAIAIPFIMISAIGLPLVSNYWKENDTKSIRALYKSSSTSILVFSLSVFLAMWLGIDDLFMLMPKGEEYRMAKSIVLLLCSAKLIDMGMGINGQIIAMSDKYKTQLWFLLVTAVINVGLNWVLIPKYGIEGSGIATVVSVVVFNILKYWFLKTRYNMSPFTKQTFYILAVGLGLYFVVDSIPKTQNSLINLLLFPSIFGLIFSFISYKSHFAPEINNFVNKQLLRIGIKPFD